MLALDQESGNETGPASRRLPRDGAESALGDHRVLVLAADVLELLQPIHQPLRGVASLGGHQLRRISRPLRPDPNLVEVRIGRRLRERPYSLAKLLELARGEIGQRDVRVDDRRLGDRLFDPVKKREVAWTVEGTQNLVAALLARRVEPPEEGGPMLQIL